MTPETTDPQRRVVAERAAQWVFDLEASNAGRHAEFVAWIKQSPLHVEEFLFASAILLSARSDIPPTPGARAPEIDTLVAEARAAPTHENIVPLTMQDSNRFAGSGQPPIRRTMPWRRALAGIAATVALAALGIAALRWTQADADATYATAMSEQRTVRLTDGTIVHLNARSRIRVHFSTGEREVLLTDGEAFFKVERDTSRPFRVRTDDAVVQAVGTQFNVDRTSESTTVAVVEGRVRVSGGDGGLLRGESVMLTVGEGARVTGRAIEKEARKDLAPAVAWRERRLVFRADRLEDIAERFSRYSPSRIRLLDRVAREKLIT